MSLLAPLTVLLPLFGASVALAVGQRPRPRDAVCLAVAAIHLACSFALWSVVLSDGFVVTQFGSWEAPLGISFVADRLSVTILVAVSLLGGAVSVHAAQLRDAPDRDARGNDAVRLPLVLVLLGGASGALLTGDLFNLFVWFEVMLLASFVLLAMGGTRRELEGALKYVALSLLASALFLSGVGLAYGATGTLNLADLSGRLDALRPTGAVAPIAVLLLTAFAIKAAVFPFFFWLPASYPTPSAAVSALLAGVVTKVAVYAMIRVATLLFAPEVEGARLLLSFAAGATMLIGVLGAAAQRELRSILSFHVVSQIGYAIMGLAIGGALAVGGAIFFIVHNIFAKSSLLLSAGLVERERGTGRLDELGGIARERPLLAAIFLVPALSLAGLPPLSGFVGKLVLVRAGLVAERWTLTAVALLVSLLTLYSMIKMWLGAFWGAERPREDASPVPRRAMWPAALLASLTVALGVLGEPVSHACLDAARHAIDPVAYRAAVLHAGGGE